jgi:DNA-directed RNA polymerase II subunit RPB2
MFKFGKVTLEKPKIYEGSGSEHATTPHECRLRNLTYESYLYIDVKETIYSYNSDRSVTKSYKNVPFGTIPLMVKSSFCALYGMTGKETASCLECPMDPGGYFIVNGSEKVSKVRFKWDLSKVVSACYVVCRFTANCKCFVFQRSSLLKSDWP